MSLLQRAPLDVNPAIFCGTRSEAIYDTTSRLLERANTCAPYAGVIVRRVLSAADIEKIGDLDALPAHSEDMTALNAVTDIVHQAMRDWWQQTPYSSDFAIRKSANTHILRRPKTGMHADQELTGPGYGASKYSKIPQRGPVTQIINLRGTVDYRLAVCRWDVFTEDGQKKLEQSERRDVLLTPRTNKAHLNAGDMLLFTNTPPTFHEARGSDDRVTAIVPSRFVRTANGG